ncbi:hypothetical protein M427DRAFT_29082 [Gonapodya prolifera JEL478]|uniref:SnoaL-like domain-containing protein n=1 Tax=Gonapodya prolifera (strain JEL478) TaxID=1344416 RepID=A0A139AQS6_GONPJ|nr:hypothetical protein M427DRAFT_29082 [Gonapodya prolifera JEL478]|eukprot:KXS19089.1 hypothetical protein M427DRAFT_29082 [Gonapodya prolifera JEL478]
MAIVPSTKPSRRIPMRDILFSSLALIGLNITLLAVHTEAHKYGNVWLSETEAFVLNAVTELFVLKQSDAVDKYWSPNYIQHNPLVANGTAALKSLTAFLGNFTYETGFVVSSGPVVAIRSRLTPERGNVSLVVDIFRVEKGKIMEHWDVIQDEVPTNQTVSGLPMFDPAEHHSYNLSSCYDEETETRNMLLAPWGLNKIFNQFDSAVFDKFWDPVYLQHNPGVASGSAALRGFIVANANASASANATTAAAATPNWQGGFSLVKCDIVFTHARVGDSVVVDTFRFRDGRFYEHWDIAQTEVPANRTASGLSMFDPEEFSLQFAY